MDGFLLPPFLDGFGYLCYNGKLACHTGPALTERHHPGHRTLSPEHR